MLTPLTVIWLDFLHTLVTFPILFLSLPAMILTTSPLRIFHFWKAICGFLDGLASRRANEYFIELENNEVKLWRKVLVMIEFIFPFLIWRLYNFYIKNMDSWFDKYWKIQGWNVRKKRKKYQILCGRKSKLWKANETSCSSIYQSIVYLLLMKSSKTPSFRVDFFIAVETAAKILSGCLGMIFKKLLPLRPVFGVYSLSSINCRWV